MIPSLHHLAYIHRCSAASEASVLLVAMVETQNRTMSRSFHTLAESRVNDMVALKSNLFIISKFNVKATRVVFSPFEAVIALMLHFRLK